MEAELFEVPLGNLELIVRSYVEHAVDSVNVEMCRTFDLEDIPRMDAEMM